MKKLFIILSILLINVTVYGQLIDSDPDTVNIGAAPNDGTGDPLRTAFNKLNLNDQKLNSLIPIVLVDSLADVRTQLRSDINDTADVVRGEAADSIAALRAEMESLKPDSAAFSDSTLFAWYADSSDYSDTSQYSFYSDTADYADTSGYALAGAWNEYYTFENGLTESGGVVGIDENGDISSLNVKWTFSDFALYSDFLQFELNDEHYYLGAESLEKTLFSEIYGDSLGVLMLTVKAATCSTNVILDSLKIILDADSARATGDLTVEGNTTTDSIYTLKSAVWSDVVFEPTYALPTLIEKEAFIKSNKHLPSLKSGAELDRIAAKNNGYLSNNEYNRRLEGLVKEVEENVLADIQKEKDIELLMKQVEELTKLVKTQQEEIEKLKNR